MKTQEDYEVLDKYAIEALGQALNALEGRYPWPVAAKYTQKEAREMGIKCVKSAIRQIIQAR